MADQIIDVPGQGKVAFPDSMTDADIVKAIQATSAKAKPAPQPSIETPAEAIAGNPITRFALGAASPFLGAAQLMANASPVFRMGGLHTKINDQLKDLEKIKETGMAAQNGGTAGFDWAGLLGNALSPATVGVLTKLPAAVGVADKVKQGAAIGGGLSAAKPIGKGDDCFTDKAIQTGAGAVIGGAIPAITNAVGGAYRVGRNVIDPWLPGGAERAAGRTLNEAAGGKRDEIIRLLTDSRKFVSGEAPTAAEVASPAGATVFSGMEKIARNKAPDRFADVTTASENARLNAVRSVSKDEQALADAVSNRATAAKSNYGAVETQTVPTSVFATFLEKPSINAALKDAGVSAKEIGSRPVGDGGYFTVKELQRIKESLDSGITAAQNAKLNGKRPALSPGELIKTRDDFVALVSSKSPDWAKARTQYREDSLPINRMEVGQELEKSLRNSLGVESPMQFTNAVREAPRTITRATTGAPRYDKLESILTPKEMDSINNVANSLIRREATNNLTQEGASKAADLAGAIVPKVPAGGMFNPKYSVFRAITNRMAGRAEGKSLDVMAEGMATPEGALRLMNAAGIPKDKRQSIIELLAQRQATAAAAKGEK